MTPALPRAGRRGAGLHPARRLVVVFAAVSAFVFGLPAALGAPWLVGDNLIQNFPLRVLVGTDLRHGHLPLWDPYLWSGSPLLAGFNAGAAYPTSILFAVLPGDLAWVLNQMAVELVAAAGVVALLRALGRSWLAAGLAAGAFAFGGFMTAQSVHLDLVQAASWLPWAFVALDRLAHRPEGKSAAPWVALLAAALGLMILSGAVEPILDGGIVLALYALWLAWRTPGRRRWHVLVGSVAGVVVAAAVAAAQLLPGAAFQAQSQRAMHTYTFFSSGSMNKSFTILGFDPLILGGVHRVPFGFIGTFNLPEISSYIGILPVMALFGLLARRHRRAPEAGQWWIWYAVLVVGLFLAWGGFTPVAHLVYDIPLYNRQRLLNRNLLEVDLALAVIFGIWIDRMFTPLIAAARVRPVPVAVGGGPADVVGAGDTTPGDAAPGDTAPGDTAPGDTAVGDTASGALVVAEPATADDRASVTGDRPRRWTSDIVLSLLPVIGVVGLQLTLLIGGPWFDHLVRAPGAVSRSSLWPLIGILTVPSAIALAAGVIVVRRGPLARRLPALLITVLVLDLAVFNAGIQSTPDPGSAASASSVTANRLATLLADQGQGPAGGLHRVAMFNPDGLYPVQANRLGQPDLTLLRSLDSVQGYGAVVNQRYDAETGTHLQANLTPSALSGNTFAPLDLGLLVTVPEYFIHLVDRPPGYGGSIGNGAGPLPPVPPSDSAPADRSTPPPTPTRDYQFVAPQAPTVALAPGQRRTQYFGTTLSVTAVTVPLPNVPAAGVLRVGLVAPDGSTRWLGPSRSMAGRTSVTVPADDRPAVGLVLLATSASAGAVATTSVGEALVRTAGQGTYRVDGSLRDIVTGSRWHYVGPDGYFSVFAPRTADGRAWVVGAAGATARVVDSSPWGSETVRVDSSRTATLVRSEQYESGWRATVTSGDHQSAETVRRLGLVQAVTVPAGLHLVRFTYHPSRAYEGLAVSAVGVIAVAGLGCWPLLIGRRRHRRPAGLTSAGDGPVPDGESS